MTLAADACYRALESRDRRFDGHFFVAVVTTGIYCRPICPAPTPRRRNTVFFSSAAAAAEAGFRACRRCRPEAAPGSAAWLGTQAAVTRALRLVSEGALDAGDVESLAARLGMGERHLRRLFDRHLGASPVAVAHTRRVHFAKRLLDETDLPVTEIAFAAGFQSIRRFNTAMREAWGAPPRELRRRGRARPQGLGIALRLACRPPFDWQAMVRYLAPRAIPGVEEVRADAYRRSAVLGDEVGVIEIRPGEREDHLVLRAPPGFARGLGLLSARARRLFDLDADPAKIQAELSRDPRLALHLRGTRGLRVPGTFDGFELAVRAVLGQQVSVAAATTLAGRLVAAFGKPLPRPDGAVVATFPTASALAGAELTSLGLTSARAAAIRALAAAVRDGELDLDSPVSPVEALARLRAIRGIGPWTAEYVALRALAEPDAFPASDLGLRRALGTTGRPLSAAQLARRAESWRPWRGYAAMALWTGTPERG